MTVFFPITPEQIRAMRDSQHSLQLKLRARSAPSQEIGTSRIPPRPVCEPALRNSLPYAADVLGEIAVTLLGGKS